MSLTRARNAYDKFVADLHTRWAKLVTPEEKAQIAQLGGSKYALRSGQDLVDLIGSARERKETIWIKSVRVERRDGLRPLFHATLVREKEFLLHYTWQASLQRSGLRVMVWLPSKNPKNQKTYDRYIDHLVKAAGLHS